MDDYADDLFHTSSSERNVQLLTNMIGFLNTIQTITRDLKLVGGKMGPNNKKLVQAFDKLQNSHSHYQDIIQSVRNLRTDIAGIKDEPDDITISTNVGKAVKKRMMKEQAEQRSQERSMPEDVQQLQVKVTALSDKLRKTQAELDKKKEYVSWLTMKNQQLAAKLPSGAAEAEMGSTGRAEVQDVWQHVTEEYRRVLGGEWSAALAEVEGITGVTRNDAYQFLSEILLVTESVSIKQYEGIFTQLNNTIQPTIKKPFPDTLAQIEEKNLELQNGKKKKAKEEDTVIEPMSVRTRTAIAECLRVSSTQVDVQYIIQEMKAELASKPKEHTTCKALRQAVKQGSYGEAVEAFIAVTARLAWRMVTQTPPMVFRTFKFTKDHRVDPAVHDMVGEVKNTEQPVVLFYIHPCLVRATEPNKLQVKGKLMCS